MRKLFRQPLVGIVCWFIIIMSAYGGAIAIVQPDVAVDRQEQRIKNRIRGERYLYGRAAYECVMVGSSMTARLPDDALGDGVYKLSFGGGGPIEGLEILVRSGRLPKVVIVETNTLAKPPLDDLVDELFAPMMNRLRRMLPMLRTEYRPASLLVSTLLSLGGRASGHTAPQSHDDAATWKILEDNVRREVVSGDHSPDEPLFTANLERLDKLVRRLREKGVEVAFLSMPMDSRVMATRFRTEILERIRERFRNADHQWLIPGEGRDFKTTDGVHLTGEDARFVAGYVRRRVRELVSAGFP